jgi:hypothetical protein
MSQRSYIGDDALTVVLIWLSHSCAEVNLDVSGLEALVSTLAFSPLLHLDHHLLVFKAL